MPGRPTFILDKNLTWEQGAENVRLGRALCEQGQDVTIYVSQEQIALLTDYFLGGSMTDPET